MRKLMIMLLALTALTVVADEVTYEVGPFDKISLMGDINIVYRSVSDSVGVAVYHSDSDFSDALEISNNKGKLTIKETPDHGLGQVPTIYVYSDYLSQIRNEGNATVVAELTAATPTLSVRLVGNGRIVCENVNAPDVKASISTGNGDIILRGKCRQASFDLAGTGVIQADSLETATVKCSVIGTGSIGCWPVENLDVRGIGTTKIYYRGEPKVKKVGGARLCPIYQESEPIKVKEDEQEDVKTPTEEETKTPTEEETKISEEEELEEEMENDEELDE